MKIIHLCAIWSWLGQGGSEITIIVESPVLASMLVVEMAGGRNKKDIRTNRNMVSRTKVKKPSYGKSPAWNVASPRG